LAFILRCIRTHAEYSRHSSSTVPTRSSVYLAGATVPVGRTPWARRGSRADAGVRGCHRRRWVPPPAGAGRNRRGGAKGQPQPMKCPRCQHENEVGAKFCQECAAPLARACTNCGRPLPPTAKFCPECAHPTSLAAAQPPAQRFDSPESYTPKHLAEKILTSKSAL